MWFSNDRPGTEKSDVLSRSMKNLHQAHFEVY